MIEWKKESDDKYSPKITDKTEYTIKGLEPGCKYDITVQSFMGMEYGTPAKLKLSTLETGSPYPYIYLGKKTEKRIDLRVFNLPADATSVTWYINGRQISADYITTGEYKDSKIDIEVEIRYTDASIEKIYKTIELD